MDISTNTIQLVCIITRASEVFEDRDIAIEWLKEPNESLDNHKGSMPTYRGRCKTMVHYKKLQLLKNIVLMKIEIPI